jgi:ferritin-like metal-binding protein YciE
MSLETLQDMFVHTLKDINYAENKILKALPKMIKQAENEDLKIGLENHLDQTKDQIERIKQVFSFLKIKPASEECAAINGILEEAEGLLEDVEDSDLVDTAIIASSQAVEHYEIVRYRSLVMWAGVLGMDEAAELLQISLNEERETDEKLLAFAEENQAHLTSEDDEDEDNLKDNSDSNVNTAKKPMKKTTKTASSKKEHSTKEKVA